MASSARYFRLRNRRIKGNRLLYKLASKLPVLKRVDKVVKKPPKAWFILRDDLNLMQGPLAYDGSPTWNLYDPVLHRYFRIGWLEFEILNRWGMADADKIANAIMSETPLNTDAMEVQQFGEFLENNQLIKAKGRESSARLAHYRYNAKSSLFKWLLHNYLFLRIPLVKPDRYLKKALPYMRMFFHNVFPFALVVGICVAAYLVSQQWTEFTHSFEYTMTPEGLLATLGMLSLSKVIHEMGHALTASHFGCRIPTMGVALILGMPVLWTDVTDAWRLPHRRERLLIDGAGMTAEITLAVIATIVWAVLPDGPMRSGSYLLASSAWIITLAINLNPFMRFDGYYLLSDTLDIPNLQDRAFAYARWQLRESLFGFGFEPPELWPKNRQYILLVYAWGTWTYRLILFTGIAWAVYYFFFKALGLALFAVEIGWFIVRPVYNEIKTWRDLFEATKTPLRPRRSWLIPLALLLVLLIPWRSHFIVPGIVVAAVENTLYCIEPAQVKEVLIKEGDKVKANQILIKLDSPDLDYKILADELKIQELSEKLASQSLELKLARNNPVDFEELQKTQAELIGFRETKAKLTIIASINGRVRDLSDLVRPGEWIAKDEPLGIIENTRYSVIGYVEEADIGHLEVGGKGRFYPEGGDIKPFPVAIEKIDKVGTRELKVEELASIYGGEIAVREGEEKKLIPEQGIYRVTMVNEDALEEIHTTVRGRLSLTTQAESIAEKLWRFSVIALVRESGW